MTKKKQISCGAKSIVLTDEQMVDEINELLAKSDYNYNFNKLANDLLARGIDSFKVDDKPTEEVKPKEEEWEDRSESVQVCEFMEELVGLMKETFRFIATFEGDVPGASPKDCGNYLMMNLPMARWEAQKFLDEVLEKLTDDNLNYPE